MRNNKAIHPKEEAVVKFYEEIPRCIIPILAETRVFVEYDKAGYATEYKYDNLGRVIEQKTPFEVKNGTVYYSTKQMWYDNNGNILRTDYFNAVQQTGFGSKTFEYYLK